MPDFVYDNTSLNYPKSDLTALPGGADATKYIQASDWNAESQAIVDLRSALKAGKWHGLTEQGSTPATPSRGNVVLFTRASPGTVSPNVFTQLCILFADGTVAVIAEGDPR